MSRAHSTPTTLVNAVVPKLTITNASDLEYFAEGAANILYRYVGKDEKFKTHLIRLRKYLPNFPTVFQLYDHLQKVFVPLLPAFVLDTQLIELSPGVLKALNGRLLGLEEERAYDKFEGISKTGNKRKGKLDEAERWGMIVEDMTPGSYLKYNRFAASLMKERRNSSKDALMGFFTDNLLQLDERNLPRATMDAAALSRFGWRDILTVEFKPKYLVQSPDAPKDWKLCRTCALRNMRSRNLSGVSTDNVASGVECGVPSRICPEYCPLDLASGDSSRIHRAMEAIVGRKTGITVINEDEVLVSDLALGEEGVAPWLDILDKSIVDLLTVYFSDPVCITRVLADLQSQFGGKMGVLTPPTPNLEVSAEDFSRSLAGHPSTTKIGEDICTAMSLRDCTVFLRFWVKPKRAGDGIDVHIECKIGDLDMKTGEGGKGVYWREVEKRLIRGEWYAGRGLADGPGCRGTEIVAEDGMDFRDYVLTLDGPPEPSQLLRNGTSEDFQLPSRLLVVPKSARTPGTTTAA